MTRDEFLENITTWWELMDFCSENDCEICEDIIDDDERDNEIDEDVADAIRYDHWYDIRGYLNDIPNGYSYYRRNGRFDYDGLCDEDFDRYKEDVLNWADHEDDVWDDDQDGAEDTNAFPEQATVDEEVEPAPEEEDFTVGDLIGMCCIALATIQQADAQRMQEEERRIRELYPKVLK